MPQERHDQAFDQEVREDLGVDWKQFLHDTSAAKRRLAEFLYNPWTELAVFGLVVVSVVLLVLEVAHPESLSAGWIGGVIHGDFDGFYFWADVALTAMFLVEYSLKLWVAPDRWYFIRHNIIDLLAILPILRIFRIGRAVRLLRLLRLLRLMRVGSLLEHRLQRVSAERQRFQSETVIVAGYLLFSLVFGTVGILVFEKGHNDGFETLGDGLWWCVVTLTTVGYGDISPVTVGGKLVAALIMFIGLSFYALMTGTLSSILIERSQRAKEDVLSLQHLRDHLVICGWNGDGLRLVDDLLSSTSHEDREVVIVQPDEAINQLASGRVHYIFDDPTTQNALTTAGLEKAGVVVVLANNRSGTAQDTDARTILTALAIARAYPDVHSIVQLMSEENAFHAANAGVDEVIVSGAYTGAMISQAVQYPGVSAVFSDLFKSGLGSQIQERPLPTGLLGKPFSEASAALFRKGQGVLIGLTRHQESIVSPAEDIALEDGDRLLVVHRIDGAPPNPGATNRVG